MASPQLPDGDTASWTQWAIGGIAGGTLIAWMYVLRIIDDRFGKATKTAAEAVAELRREFNEERKAAVEREERAADRIAEQIQAMRQEQREDLQQLRSDIVSQIQLLTKVPRGR